MKTSLLLTSVATLMLGFTSVSFAQTEDYGEGLLKPNTDGNFQKNEVDSMGESTFGGGFDPMQLIHNANFRRGRNGAEFAEDTRNGLNDAAEEFKRLQQQRMLEQTQEAESEVNPSADPEI
ncbi:MAG: hypothetical protein AB4058_01360 [Microcystaceae cyanobacterium]